MNRTFFATSICAQRRALFQHTLTADLFIEILFHYRDQRKYLLHEFVIMPDHFHVLLTPATEISLEKAIQFIKGGFSFRLKSGLRSGRRVLRIIVFEMIAISKIIELIFE